MYLIKFEYENFNFKKLPSASRALLGLVSQLWPRLGLALALIFDGVRASIYVCVTFFFSPSSMLGTCPSTRSCSPALRKISPAPRKCSPALRKCFPAFRNVPQHSGNVPQHSEMFPSTQEMLPSTQEMFPVLRTYSQSLRKCSISQLPL